MDEDRLDRYAEAAWHLRCERMTAAKERPSGITTWEDRAPFLRDIDKDVAALVAGMAVMDAGIDLTALHADILRLEAERDQARAKLAEIKRLCDRYDWLSHASWKRHVMTIIGAEEVPGG